MKTFRQLLYLLTSQERKKAFLLLIMITVMALIDMLGVASILPFMTVLTNPNVINTNEFLSFFFQISKLVGIENEKQFIIFLGLIVFFLLIVSLSFKAFTTYAQLRFVQMREYSISKKLVQGYLNQPYSWFLLKHSSDLGKNILSEVQQVIASGMNPLLELIAKSLVTIALITLLVLVDPKLALIVGTSLISIYLIIFYFVRNYLNKLGQERFNNNQLRFKSVVESFGAIKEVKLRGLEKKYLMKFKNSAKIFAHTQATSQAISQLPRFILEATAFGGILLILIYIISKTGNFNSALPILSLYVFAGYRMMPALQQIYSSITQLTFIGPALFKLCNEIKDLKLIENIDNKNKLYFNRSLRLKNINYSYPNSKYNTLKDINLSIQAKSTIGVVGVTGSGKTTLIDVILGLLDINSGSIEVDNVEITKKNLRSWQNCIGYVPQHIYLSDDTIEANIAFGEKLEYIDYDKIIQVSKVANLHNFVKNELPEKYQTTIGERGVRLSGGQRQRIGIARALYNNPSILILDEATSALDDQTEKAVMDAINNLGKDITIIVIAHRLNTLKDCDIIFRLNKGKLKIEQNNI